MDKQIVSLYAKRKEDELKNLLKSSGLQQVTQCLVQCIESGKDSVVEVLEAILAGYPPLTIHGSQGRLTIFKVCLHQVNVTNLSAKAANEIVGLLLLYIDSLGEDAVVEIVSVLLDAIRSGNVGIGRSHPILSKILSVVGKFSKITFDGADLTGVAYRDQLINNICSVKWDPKVVLHLVSMFREVNLSDSELLFVLDKVLRSLATLTEPHEIPPLISQVLLLSSKGHRRFVIERVCGIFASRDHTMTASTESDDDGISRMASDHDTEWRHAEGTALLHFMYSIKQDPEMGKEFVKYLKVRLSTCGATSVLHPFVIAVAMVMVNMNRFESLITDVLKAAVMKHYRSTLIEQASPWLYHALHRQPHNNDGIMKAASSPGDVLSTLFIRTVRYSSTGGWDAVVPGFVHLGFALMDAYGVKGSSQLEPQLQYGRASKTPACSASGLAKALLLATFEAHEVARQSILDHIICRVVIQSAGSATHFLDLLNDAVKAAPQAVLECLPRVREALEHLTHLPYPTAERLLFTVQPLLKISSTLRDATLIMLRKTMFGRSVEERKIAVTGFLMLLKNFKILGGIASSQTQTFSIALSQVPAHNPGSSSGAARTKAFCLEVLGILRRSLTLQADVRHCLYEGLYSAVSSNTQLCAPVLDLLLMHLLPYVGSSCAAAATSTSPGSCSSAVGSSNQAPLHLKACITHQSDQVCISEPLSHLVSCLARCGVKAMDVMRASGDDDEDDISDAVRRMQATYSSLSSSLAACHPEDFELDQAAEFSPSSNVGLTNSLKALLAIGVYEGIMEYELSAGKFSKEACERTLTLFARHQAFGDLISEKSVGPTSSKSSSKASKPPTTLFTLSFLAETVHSVILAHSNSSMGTSATKTGQAGLIILRSNKAFVSFLIRAMLARFLQIQEKGTCDGFDGKSRDKIFKAVCLGAESLLDYCCKACSSLCSTTEDDPLIAPAFECLVTAYRVVGEWYGDRIADFLNVAGEDDSSATGANVSEKQASFHLKALQKCLDSTISCRDDAVSTTLLGKIAVHLVDLIRTVTGWLHSSSDALKDTYDSIHAVCAKKTLGDGGVGKAVLVLLLHLSKMQLSLPATIRSIAQDLHFILGDVEQDVSVEASHNFASLSEQNAVQVMQAALSLFDADLDAVIWLIEQLTGLLTTSATSNASAGEPTTASSSTLLPEDVGRAQMECGQKAAVNRLGVLALGLYDLIQTAVPFGPASEALIKSQSKLYDVLTSLLKFLLQLCGRSGDINIGRLEKLVKLVGMQLTPYVYSFITYMQAMQSEHLRSIAEKKKTGRAKSGAVSNVGKAQVRKESKFIPNLIFAIEQYERFLVQLAKKLKVNFTDYVKLSTSRDFRINPASLRAALEQQEEADVTTAPCSEANPSTSVMSGTTKENNPPSAKKPRKLNTSKASSAPAMKASQSLGKSSTAGKKAGLPRSIKKNNDKL